MIHTENVQQLTRQAAAEISQISVDMTRRTEDFLKNLQEKFYGPAVERPAPALG
jgi:hypothetical protein